MSDAMVRGDIAQPGRLPYFGNAETLLVATDFSGNLSDSYQFFSYLVLDQSAVLPWSKSVRLLRASIPDRRRLSYKDLNDTIRLGVLGRFLEAADELPGVLFTIGIDRRLPSVFPAGKTKAFAEEHGWKSKNMERALVVMHFLSFLVAGLSRPKQNLWWLCDNDAIFSNRRMRDKVAAVFQRVFIMYLPQSHVMGWYDIKTPADDPNDLVLEDLLAIPDIAAGSALDHFNGAPVDTSAGLPRRVALSTPRSDAAFTWLSRPNSRLAKFLVILSKPTEGKGVVPLWLDYGMEFEEATSSADASH